MVRAPAHALTRSTGFALLKPASRPQLDSARIVTLSGTIALNLLAFALVALVLGLVGGAVHPVLGNLLVAMAGLGFVAGVLVLLVGGGYLAWRDTFGEGPAAMPGDVHGIEV